MGSGGSAPLPSSLSTPQVRSSNLIITERASVNMQLCFSAADKHKMERFLRPDAPTVVSVYAPITFSPAGVLLFKQRSDGRIAASHPAGLI